MNKQRGLIRELMLSKSEPGHKAADSTKESRDTVDPSTVTRGFKKLYSVYKKRRDQE